MADKSKLDFSGWDRAFNLLEGEFKEALAARMAVEGGVLIRDEAKTIAATRKPDRKFSMPTGTWANSFYLAKSDVRTTQDQVVYSVSWNAKKAPHGHLAEYGHNNYYVIKQIKGQWRTMAKGKGGGPNAQLRPGGPKRIAATPALRPAIDGRGAEAVKVMIERGKTEFPILLAEMKAKAPK